MIKDVFLDLDDTILDFHRAEKEAIAETLEHYGFEASEKLLSRYSEINMAEWKLLEQKKITIDEVKTERFRLLLSELHSDANADDVALFYEKSLKEKAYLYPEAEQALSDLSKKYRLWLASNGTETVQKSRVKKSGISKYFCGMFVSERIGFFKPDAKYFEHCFSQVEDFSKENSVMVGDSLTSDIRGGMNAGIRTVWINHRNEENNTEAVPDYELKSLSELCALLEKI